MGKFLFQLIGTIITLVIIGFIGYAVFTRLFQYWEEKEPLDDVVAVDIANPANEQKTEIVISNDNRSLKESIIKQVKERIIKETSNTGNISASVKNIYVDHNVLKGGVKGMQIAVEFESKNLKDEALYCMVRFYNDDGSPLVQQSNNKKYRSVNGNVIVGEYTSPTYDDCKTRTTLFIPYKELPQNTGGRTDLILDASILHYTTSTDYEVLDRSKTYSFYLMDD